MENNKLRLYPYDPMYAKGWRSTIRHLLFSLGSEEVKQTDWDAQFGHREINSVRECQAESCVEIDH